MARPKCNYYIIHVSVSTYCTYMSAKVQLHCFTEFAFLMLYKIASVLKMFVLFLKLMLFGEVSGNIYQQHLEPDEQKSILAKVICK